MRVDAIALSVGFSAMISAAMAESANDPLAQLRACFQMEVGERLECLDKLSRTTAPVRPTPGQDNWIISETTSPVDYTPIVAATTFSRSASNGASMQLTIHCRGGRTEVVIAGLEAPRSSKEYTLSYRINDERPAQVAAGTSSSGTGVALTGDVIRLLQSLPDEGDIAVRLSTRTGTVQEVSFSLGRLKTVREKVGAACKWPNTIAAPRNQLPSNKQGR